MDFDRLEVKQVRIALVPEQKSFLPITNQDPAFILNSKVSHLFSSPLRQMSAFFTKFDLAEFALCQRSIIEIGKNDQRDAPKRDVAKDQ